MAGSKTIFQLREPKLPHKFGEKSMSSTIETGQSSPLGATVFADGVNFSVFSKNATDTENGRYEIGD
jgi:hypothetical protein